MPDPIDPIAGAAAPAADLLQPIAPAAAEASAAVADLAPAAVASPAAGAELPAAAEPAAAAEVPGSEPTLLESFVAGADPAAKPADPAAKPGDPAVPGPADPAAAAPPLPAVDYKYALPETLQLDDAQRTDVHSAFDAFRANPAEGAQALVDLHAKLVGEAVQQVRDDQFRIFNDTRKAWRTEVMADPELGGGGYNTSMAAIARMRDLGISRAQPGSPEHKADVDSFNTFLRVTGAGDHPAFLKLMHNFARYFDEPALPPTGAKPPPNNGANPNQSRRERMYNNTNVQP